MTSDPVGRPRRSLWAIASIVTSAALCPPLCVLGPALGIVALVEVRRRPGRRGRGLAVAGIALGLAVTSGWIALGVWWDTTVRQPMIHGPAEAIHAGLTGDVDAFRSAFLGPAGSEEEARAFLGAVAERYGDLVTVRQNPDAASPVSANEVGAARLEIEYMFRFDRRSVGGSAQFVIAEESRRVLRWGWVHLRDPDRGDLIYPVAAAPAAPPPPAPGPDGDAPP